MRYFILIFLLCLSNTIEAKVLVVTLSYNRPDFISIQNATFKKFLKDDYEFIVFNDASDPKLEQKIKITCEEEGLRHFRIPQTIHQCSPKEISVRAADGIHYLLNLLGFDHDDVLAIIDSDMFLIKDFSIKKYLEGYVLSGVKQHRKHLTYLWNGLLFFDIPKLPNKKSINFDCGTIQGIPCDTGGYTYYYLKNNPNLPFLPMLDQIDLFEGSYVENIYEYPEYRYTAGEIKKSDLLNRLEINSPIWHLVDGYPHNSQFFLNFSFFHYRAGTNWNNKSNEYHLKKTRLLNEFIERLLE